MERTTLVEVDIDRYGDRLSIERIRVVSPGTQSTEENAALNAFLKDLRGLLVSTRHPMAPSSADLHELFRLLTTDLGCVCPRLSYAA